MNISLQKKIEHWFNFLRLAHESNDPAIKRLLAGSSEFYAAWGEYRSQPFNEWWREHRQLFRKISSIRTLTTDDDLDASAFYLVIPYTYAPTVVGKIVQRMYAEAFELRAQRKGKVKKVYDGDYALSSDEFQASQFTYYYRYAKDVYLPLLNSGGSVKTKDFVVRAVNAFRSQRQVKSHANAKRGVPFKTSSSDYANLSKRAREYNKIVENILRNVAAGTFPGDYLTASVKNQGIKRIVQRKTDTRVTPKRGVPQGRYVKKKKRKDELDPHKTFV